MVDLVVLDDYEASDCRGEGNLIEASVPICAIAFLVFGVGGLENENGLREEEDGGLEVLVLTEA